MSITVPYKVLARGYELTGGRDKPLRATVPYLLKWADAFTFFDQVLGYASSTIQGGVIIRSAGHQFPPAPRLFAEDCEIEPCGAGGDAITPTHQGLKPGEFFTHAKATVTYTVPSYPQESDRLNQLDPDNPITYCEQSVEIGGRFETQKAGAYEFEVLPGGVLHEPVRGDFAKIATESQLVLTFPFVPYLPWRKIKPYIGSLNDAPTLGSDVGNLLFLGTSIKANNTSVGIQGQSVQLKFADQDYDWNMLPRANGLLDLVRKKGDSSQRIYPYKDLRELFQ